MYQRKFKVSVVSKGVRQLEFMDATSWFHAWSKTIELFEEISSISIIPLTPAKPPVDWYKNYCISVLGLD